MFMLCLCKNAISFYARNQLSIWICIEPDNLLLYCVKWDIFLVCLKLQLQILLYKIFQNPKVVVMH